MFNSQTVRFEEYTCLLEPHEKVVVIAFKLNVTKASNAKHVAAYTDTHLVLFINLHGRHLGKFLKSGFASG